MSCRNGDICRSPQCSPPLLSQLGPAASQRRALPEGPTIRGAACLRPLTSSWPRDVEFWYTSVVKLKLGAKVETVDRLAHLRPDGTKRSQHHFDALTTLPHSFSSRHAPLSRTIASEVDEDMSPAERYARAIQKRDAMIRAQR
jgi:hypothetical protein